MKAAQASDFESRLFALSEEIFRLLELDDELVASAPSPIPLCTLTNEQIEKVEDYRSYLVYATIKKGISPKNDVRMFKAFLDYYSLKVPFDIDDYLEEGDIVEVYGEDFVQIYRNRKFFNFCSYDLFTLLAYPFPVLFRRDDVIVQKIVARALECMSGQSGIAEVGIEDNLLQEHFAKNSNIFKIEHKWCSPVFSRVNDKPLGVFCSMVARQHGVSNVFGIGHVRESTHPMV